MPHGLLTHGRNVEVRYAWRWNGKHWYSWAIGTVPYVVIYPTVKEDGSVVFDMQIFTDAKNGCVKSQHKKLGHAIGDAQGFITGEVVKDYFKSELDRMAKICDRKGKTWDKVKSKIEPILGKDIAVTWEQYNP